MEKQSVKIQEIKRGEFFTLKPYDYPTEKQVYVKGEYDRQNNSYTCIKFSDISQSRLVKTGTKVYTDFIFKEKQQ